VARGGGQRDEAAVSRFIERFASAMVEAGMPRMPARVFVALLASDSGRRTAAELSAVLQVSPAAVSGAVRWLEQVNLAGREREPGSRRDSYHILDDLWYEASIRRDQMLPRWMATAREGVTALGPDTPAGRRIAETVDFFEFVQEELPAMLKKWREHRAAGDRRAADRATGDRATRDRATRDRTAGGAGRSPAG
jgi:DNA-binding transcriptional regulator GbsR (MarR family)